MFITTKYNNLQTILGIWDGHCASAALICQGRIVAALSEERVTRRKRNPGFPYTAIETVLNVAKIDPGKVDLVALAGKFGRAPFRLFDRIYSRRANRYGPNSIASNFVRHLENLTCTMPLIRTVESAIGVEIIKNKLVKQGFSKRVKLVTVAHHLAHACGAAVMFPQDGVLVTMDGYGDGLWCTCFQKQSSKLRLLYAVPYFSSVAITYGSVTQLLGYSEGDEGKVTALAAKGNKEILADFFSRRFKRVFTAGARLVTAGGPLTRKERKYLQNYRAEDIAAGLQFALEQTVVPFIARLVRKKNAANVGLAGGLFANVKLNGEIVRELNARTNVYVYPAMGDEGLSLGACLAAWLNYYGALPQTTFTHAFLGQSPLPSDNDVRYILGTKAIEKCSRTSLIQRAAAKLRDGYEVAVVRQREEFGPRALGNRSLLFSAADAAIAATVTRKLRRDPVMPYAPICRANRVEKLFNGPFPVQNRADRGLGFMTFTCKATEITKKMVAAGIHFDGTSRVQVVTQRSNKFLWDILARYEEYTGIPILINTSFNLHAEPIVHSASDACYTFLATQVHAMILEDLWIQQGVAG